jgi:hypothetical protein
MWAMIYRSRAVVRRIFPISYRFVHGVIYPWGRSIQLKNGVIYLSHMRLGGVGVGGGDGVGDGDDCDDGDD